MSLTWNQWWMRLKDSPLFWPFSLCCFPLLLSCDRATCQPSYSLSREELKNLRFTFLKDSLFQISLVNPVSSLAIALGLQAYQFRFLLRSMKKQCFLNLPCVGFKIKWTELHFDHDVQFHHLLKDSKLRQIIKAYLIYTQCTFNPASPYTDTMTQQQFLSEPD